MLRRHVLILLLTSAALAGTSACGGPSSSLRTVKSPTGSGAVEFSVQNGTDVVINNIYVAETNAVRAAGRITPSSPEEAELWGNDRLVGSGLEVGGSVKVELRPGAYDFRILDRDSREQRITHVRVGAGGKYVLELGEGGWRRPVQ